MIQRMDWRSFENSLKTEARFFNRTAATISHQSSMALAICKRATAAHWWWMRVPEPIFIPLSRSGLSI
jgi:hypothetical protein